LRDIRKDVKIPLVFMGYLNPIMQFGFENFCRKCLKYACFCSLKFCCAPVVAADETM